MATELKQIGEQQQQMERMQALFKRQQQAFREAPMPSADKRIADLKKLKQMILDHQQTLIEAINEDFGGRSSDESLLAEIMPSIQGVNYAIKHLKRWMKPSKRHVGAHLAPAKAQVVYQPLGVVGIVVPWNYPLFLAVGPLTTALAAGNRAMVKMSEYTPATAQLFARLVEAAFSEEEVAVINGEAEVGARFSELPFDHLLFTGSTSVGRHVMRAAADNLTPVTLELGGKSPAIVGPDVPLADAAERICFGKSFNAGQTCVAPDYVLVPKEKEEAFVEAYRTAFTRMFPSLKGNPDYTHVINQRQHSRLNAWLQDAVEKGARVTSLGDDGDEASRCMPLQIVQAATDEMTLMQDEIFGPILPIVPYDTLEQALDYVKDRPRPLALYYFSYDKQSQQFVMENTHSGGACINETLFHVAVDDMPFGGIGPSGMGHYHGKEGFQTLSKAKGVFIKQKFNAARMIFPPYNKPINRLLYKLFIR
ncbi:coniferyl aldehyde dehydrogenase [Aestuariirhabdus litorea]|uniref:Aldehyde dehydrogenase n=1 Tax=Aestuariirhabdus litorea TaxID=2528527 RepID=A0A3P3VJ01_9GAMM|nr:coniferyl aldehyde dehydrogenase [Aestuariirhabdus litorea]RRJ82680.1 coniferyl aldehyde dehydrogenase [Aestuariirhabdus litorea]RWW92840.1 aldehyde dehydrogenase family protein [Endozoicomonadaceae bacterium GTF-13]